MAAAPCVESEPLRPLEQVRIAKLVPNDGVDDAKLSVPVHRLRSQGATVDVVAPPACLAHLVDGLPPSRSVPVARVLTNVGPTDDFALPIPGGVTHSDQLRMNPEAVASCATSPVAKGQSA